VRIAARLKRLEQGRGTDGCGPDCPPQAVVVYHQDGFDGEPTLAEGQRPPAPCRRCGRPARVVGLVLIYDPDFFHKPERVRNRAPEQTTTAGPVDTKLP
jgi:hypothetical protein